MLKLSSCQFPDNNESARSVDLQRSKKGSDDSSNCVQENLVWVDVACSGDDLTTYTSDEGRSSIGEEEEEMEEGEEDHSSSEEVEEYAQRGRKTRREDTYKNLPLTGLAQMDRVAQQLYDAAPANTLMVVVTQGSLKTLKQLAAKKLR